jgi:hypothetical protein
MQVIGIGVYSRRAIFFFAALMTYLGFISDQGSGIALAPIAMAQDNLELDAKGDSDSAVADASDPVLVVSIASLNKLMQDVNYITSVVGQPQAGGMFTMMAGGFAQGLDMARPIGIMVPIVDGAPEPIGLLPTPDVEAMLKRLEAQTGPVDKLDDGTLVLAAGPSLVYIRQVDSWAVIARQKEFLDLAPADPMSLMEDLGDNYTLSARLNVQLIPEETREGLIAQMRQGFEQAMAQQGEEAESIQAASEDSIKQIEQLIREAEELMIGWNINAEEKVVTFEAEFIAAEGTDMAEMYAGQAPIPSKFASVIDDENAMYYHAAASIGPKMVEQTEESVKNARTMFGKAIEDSDDLDENAKTQVTELMNSVVDLIGQTIAEGKFDLGVQAVADDGQLDITAGMFVSDGEAAAKIVKDLAEELKSEPNAPTFEFDQETYKDVTLHSMMIAIPADEEELRETLGEQAVVKIGTAKNAVYLAAGTDSEQAIKGFIDNATDDDDPTDRPIGQMQIRLLPFLRFAQSVNANDVVASMIDTLSQDDETDYMLLEANMVENGQSTYLEVGEGILKAIGAAVREAQMQRMKEAQGQGGGQF